jgi:hypothetical protein
MNPLNHYLSSGLCEEGNGIVVLVVLEALENGNW